MRRWRHQKNNNTFTIDSFSEFWWWIGEICDVCDVRDVQTDYQISIWNIGVHAGSADQHMPAYARIVLISKRHPWQDVRRLVQDTVGVPRFYLSESAAPMVVWAATSQRRPSPLGVSLDDLGAGRVRLAEARGAGKLTCTPSGTLVVTEKMADSLPEIREHALSIHPCTTAPAGEGENLPRPS